MAQIDTIEREDAPAEAARRIRDHYGERLACPLLSLDGGQNDAGRRAGIVITQIP